MRQWLWLVFLLVLCACKQKSVNNRNLSANNNPVAIVVPPHSATPAFYFKKFECRTGDTAVIDLYLQQIVNGYNSDTITHVIASNTKNEKTGYLSGTVKPNGEFVFSSYEKDTITGWFSSDTSIYINTYRVNTTNSTSLVFKQQSLPYSVVPLSYYSARQEVPEKNGYRNSLCDSFVSAVNFNSIQFKSDSLGVSKINRLLEKYPFRNVGIKSRPAPAHYSQQSEFVSILYAGKGFATVQISVHDYGCSAAHGMFSTHYLNYSFVLGNTLSLTDIIRAEAMDKLADIVRQRFVAKYGEPEQGWTFHLTNNVAILKTGLLFKYQVYEMGPFAAGDMDVFIPYSHINLLFNHNRAIDPILAGF